MFDPRATFYYGDELRAMRREAFALGLVVGAALVEIVFAALSLWFGT